MWWKENCIQSINIQTRFQFPFESVYCQPATSHFWTNYAIVNRLMYIMPQSHWPCDHVATYIRPQSMRIADKSLTNGAIDLRICGWSYEQTLSQQGRWSCSKLRTCDYKSQEVAHRLYTTSHQGSYHQSRMIVGWQIAQLVWRLTGRPLVWSCHL